MTATLRYRMRATQAQFAELLGVSQVTVARWETQPGSAPSGLQLAIVQALEQVPDGSLQAIMGELRSLGPLATVHMLLCEVFGSSPTREMNLAQRAKFNARLRDKLASGRRARSRR